MASAARLLEAHFQVSAARLRIAVQGCLRSSGLVAFHFDETEALAASSENICGQVNGPDSAIG